MGQCVHLLVRKNDGSTLIFQNLGSDTGAGLPYALEVWVMEVCDAEDWREHLDADQETLASKFGAKALTPFLAQRFLHYGNDLMILTALTIQRWVSVATLMMSWLKEKSNACSKPREACLSALLSNEF